MVNKAEITAKVAQWQGLMGKQLPPYVGESVESMYGIYKEFYAPLTRGRGKAKKLLFSVVATSMIANGYVVLASDDEQVILENSLSVVFHK